MNAQPFRILVVDDDAAVRATYRHILQPAPSELGGLEALITGNKVETEPESLFQVVAADQGETAATLQREALEQGRCFQLAFIDMRMPPGWDGMRTAVALRAQDPAIFIVIATAFTDYDVNQLQNALGHDVVMLRKPFNQEEVFQLARTLCQSWATRQRLEAVTAELEQRVEARTAELNQRILQQQALTEIASRFIEQRGIDTLDDAVAWSLARIGRVLDVDACSLFRLNPGAAQFSLIHEWTALGVKPLVSELETLSHVDVSPAYARLLRGESFSFLHLHDLPDEMGKLRAGLQGHFESCLAVPVEIDGRLSGFLAIGLVQPKAAWDAQQDQLLRTTGHIIARALEAHDASRKILENQALLSATEHAAHIGNWQLDAQTLRADWDDEVRRIVGIGPDQAVGPDLLARLVDPADWPALEASLRSALEQGTSHRLEYRICRPVGDVRWVQCWAEAQQDADGRVLRLVGMLQDITEFHQSNERLHRLTEAVEKGPASVVITDKNGIIEYVNRRFMEVTGYSAEEAIGQNPRILKSGSTPAALYEEMWRTLLAGRIWQGELENRRKDGSLYWEKTIIQSIPDDQGNVSCFMAINQDISETRRTVQVLRESQDKFATLVQNIPGMVYRCALDEHWTIQFMSDFIETLSGYPVADFVDNRVRSYASIIHPDDVALVDQGVRAAVTAHQPHVLEYRICHADGSVRWVHERGQATQDADGQVAWLDGVITDITQRKQAETILRQSEQRLRQSEARYRSIVETADEGIWQVDPQWRTTYVNQRMEELLACSPGGMLGRPIGDFLDAGERDRIGALKLNREHGLRETHDFDFRRDDGGVLHALVSAAPDLDEYGTFRGATAMVTDISPRKRFEATLAATAEFVSRPGGTEFCAALVEHAARTLGLDYMHLARLQPGGQRVETEAAWLDGRAIANWGYDLADTPCSEVIKVSHRLIATGVQARYPKDADLGKVGAEGYVGEPVIDAAGTVLGLIVGITHSPMQHTEMIQANLRILAARAAAEWQQRQALQALQGERDTSRNILQTAQAIIVALDRDGRITLINRMGCELLGYSEAELLGQDWFATCLPADSDVEAVRQAFRKQQAEDLAGSEYFENPVRTRSGEERLIAWHNSSIHANDGGVIGGMSAGLDITERRQADQALREEREKLRFILDLVPIGIWLQDSSGKMSFVNQAFCQAVGIPESSFLSVPHYAELIPAEFRQQCLASDVKALASDGVSDNIQRLPFVDGRIHDLRVIKAVKRDAQGRPLALVGLSLDITDELAQQQALRDSEIKFHTMLDWTHDVEYWLAPDGRFHYLTPSIERVTGYPVSAFIEDPDLINRIVHAADRKHWQAHLRQAPSVPERGVVVEINLRIEHRNGTSIWVSHTCRSVFDDQGVNLGRRVTLRDISARKAAEEQIRHLAYFDPLTGLPNRRLLMDRLGHALVTSQRRRQFGALMILDLDHFKALNDTLGHDVGDLLLIEVAQRMQASVRHKDTVSRLGGDEYVVILEDLGPDEQLAAQQAEVVAEKVRAALAQHYFLSGQEHEHHSAASIGLTLFDGTVQSAKTILKQADVALYQAKDGGRNTVRFFNPAMQAAIDARTAMEKALRRGLEKGELQLYYQPQVNQHGRLIGAEALLRWLPPDADPIPPTLFIPLAESTGLIIPIGQWVFDQTFAELKSWETQADKTGLQLSVNVSASQFHQPDFVAQIRDSLLRSGADPARLKLELTESAVLLNIDESIQHMHALRKLGIAFALDDFGTGYSSLSYLKRLPLDQVKIDQSFVRDLSHDPNDAAIVRAILAMSHSLGLKVIAEGVETEAQRDFLIKNGCTDFQGFLFGKPLPMQHWVR